MTGIIVFSLFSAAGPVEPPDVAFIRLFAEKVYQNSHGYWEARFRCGIDMVYIPGGEFVMGTPAGEPGREKNEGPSHRVYLDGYWIAKYEVSRSLWRLIMDGRSPVSPKGDDREPANRLTWDDARRFILRLNRKTGLLFRLPSEAEWEKACRAGSREARYAPLNKAAWYAANSGGRAHPVGLKRPNDYGLYDMLGNVWEWCGDWYRSDYYSRSPRRNPGGPGRGTRRVVRGGGFAHGFSYLRCGHRNSLEPDKTRGYLGFRLVLSEPGRGWDSGSDMKY